jgi:hypothetical protein
MEEFLGLSQFGFGFLVGVIATIVIPRFYQPIIIYGQYILYGSFFLLVFIAILHIILKALFGISLIDY